MQNATLAQVAGLKPTYEGLKYAGLEPETYVIDESEAYLRGIEMAAPAPHSGHATLV